MQQFSPGKPRVVAEVGCNHRGELRVAKDMIAIAALHAGADVVKFQKRCPRELLTPEQYAAPHPNPVNSYGDTYGAHREFLELDLDAHRELKVCCEQYGIAYSCSVWDQTSAQEIASLDPEFIKIPSACNTHVPMLRWLCEHYRGSLHVSLGMTSLDEEQTLMQLVREYGRQKDLVLYSCTSGYPVAPQDVCLLEIPRLRRLYGQEVQAIGFSGHHLGIALDVAALTLGAGWVERHFTLDRRWKGTDHAASLEAEDLRRLVQDLGEVAQALCEKSSELLEIEKPQREKLKWRPRNGQEKHSAA